MHPILIQFGPLTLYTYGLLVAMAFLAGLGLALRQAKREGIDPQQVMDLAFYVVIAAIGGSRLLYVLMNPGHYLQEPLSIFKIWEGGLVFYGGLLFALPISALYVIKKHLTLATMADIFAPSLALGHAIGRWGCFFAGCCYGKPTDLPWAITFTDPHSLAPRGIPLHPTQIYESAMNLSIFFLLLAFQGRKRHPGQVFWLYLLLYSIGRFLIEYLRGDERGMLLGLSTSQFLGIFLALLAILMLLRPLRGAGQGRRAAIPGEKGA